MSSIVSLANHTLSLLQTQVAVPAGGTDAINTMEGLDRLATGPMQSDPNALQPEPGPLARLIPDSGYGAVDGAVDTLANAITNLAADFIRMLPQIIIAVVVLVATALIARWLHSASRGFFRKLRFRPSLRELFAQFVYIGVWFAGVIVACSIVFPGFGPGQLVATAGLASIAIGFAFQDIFENFFAGILILWRFPFDNGDFIEVEGVEGVEGKVEDIWIRMTLIRKTNGELVLVPNATIYKNPVRVLTNKKSRRLSIAAGIAYGEDIPTAREVITQAVRSCPSVHQHQPIQVFAEGFGASSIDFEVAWWTGPTPLDHRSSRDEVVEAIKRELDAAGIEIPYPYRTLVFSKNEPDIINAVQGRLGGGATGQGGEGEKS